MYPLQEAILSVRNRNCLCNWIEWIKKYKNALFSKNFKTRNRNRNEKAMKNWIFCLFPLWIYSIWKISKPFVWFFLCQQTVLLKFEGFVEESRTQTLIKRKIYRDSATSNIISSIKYEAVCRSAWLSINAGELGIWNVKSLLYLLDDIFTSPLQGPAG